MLADHGHGVAAQLVVDVGLHRRVGGLELSRYTRLRGGQVSNALRSVHLAPDPARRKVRNSLI